MTIIRKNLYVSINVNALRDEKLSWGARGLLAYLLSMPEDGEIHTVDLNNINPNCKKNGLASLMKELEEHKYLERREIKDEKNKSTWEYLIHETPYQIEKEEAAYER